MQYTYLSIKNYSNLYEIAKTESPKYAEPMDSGLLE